MLKGTVPRVSPKAISRPLGPFQILSKICGDIHSTAQGAPPVSLTPVANGKKPPTRKVLIIFGTPVGS
jgi:hypothetical protein